MEFVEPEVFVIARTGLDYPAIHDYLRDVGGEDWVTRREAGYLEDSPYGQPAQDLTEFAGRVCYRSWKPGLNLNVTKIREDQEAYLANVLDSRHGSVLEHASYTFVIRHASRVLTHELVRHRPGCAVSQESLRYVRLDSIPVWIPEWALDDDELIKRVIRHVADAEDLQRWMAGHFSLDDPKTPFAEKKKKTSFMRRLAPEGVATDIVWTANMRALRHVIETRTAPGAEEEIRLVFGKIAEIMVTELPRLFGDFTENNGTWTPEWSKP